MKIGCCVGTSAEKAKVAAGLGYDFVESNCGAIVNASMEELDALKNAGIPVFSANCFIGHRVVGPGIDENAIDEYVSELFRRADYLGMKILVFGSSGARKALEGQDPEDCRRDIVTFLKKFVVPQCEKYNIRVAIEPLRKEECNVINTVPQGIEIAEKVGSEYIRVLADVKHMESENDPVDKIPEYNGMVIHAHTSNPYPDIPGYDLKRSYPRTGDKYNQDLFFLPLIKAGVQQCTIEADVIDFEKDIEESIKVLKKYQ